MGVESRSEESASVPRRVWRGTILLVGGRLWGSFCTFLTLTLLARVLPAEAFGRYTFYLALFVFLDTLADFGTGQIAVQRTAADPDATANVLAATRRIRFVTGSIGVALIAAGALLAREPGTWWLVAASLYPVTHVLELSSTVFRTRIALGIPVLMRFVASTLSLVLAVGLVAAGDRAPEHILCAVALGSASANVLLHLASRPHLPRERASAVPLREIFLAAAPLGLASLCQQGYFYIDNLFVRPLCGDEELGRYNAAVRILSYSIMGAIYASQAALPWLARAHERGELSAAIARLSQPLFALAGLVAGALCPFAEGILSLVYDAHFAGAGAALRWLLAATAVIHAGSGLMTALVAAGRARSILWISLAALALNVGLNAWLVRTHGIEGAGIATLATELAVTAGAAIALRRAGVMLSARAWGWLGGPAGFALGAAVSGWIANT